MESGEGSQWPVGPREHPLLAGAAIIESALDEMAGADPMFLPPTDKRDLLVQLSRLESRLAAVRLHTMATADDAAAEEGARDAAALLTHHTHGDASQHRRDLRLAEALDRRWELVRSALARGDLNLPQAWVIAHALDELPSHLEPEILVKAETRLVAEAAHHGPRDLRVLGRRILDVVAPDVGEDEEARQLDAEERRAEETTSLTFTPLGDGTTRIVGRVPDAVAGRLRTYLEAFTSPRRRPHTQEVTTSGGAVAGQKIPPSRRLGHAFAAFLENADPQRMPVHGGDATTVIVTIPLADLTKELSAAGLSAGEAISAAQVRRLACTAGIIPAVLGDRSEVLDLGRSSRLFRPAQRKAMVVRDRECRAEGCTIPATWCEAHHAGRPWAQGGRTDLDDGILLCAWHHHRAHDPTYISTRTPTGDVAFARTRRAG